MNSNFFNNFAYQKPAFTQTLQKPLTRKIVQLLLFSLPDNDCITIY